MQAPTKYLVNVASLRAEALSPGVPREGPDLQRREREALEKAAELSVRSPACYLVTGYRGVGKSTFINIVAAAAGDPAQPVVVVEVNGAIPGKDEDRPRLLLRKMQRSLYESLQRRRLLRLLPGALRKELRLAYLQTSFTVTHKATSAREVSFNLELTGWIKQSVWGILTGAILTALPALGSLPAWLTARSAFLGALAHLPAGWDAHIRPWLAVPYQAGAMVIGILAVTVPKLAAGWSRKDETEIATLYDDEVAETTFIRLLQKLHTTPAKERRYWPRVSYQPRMAAAWLLQKFGKPRPAWATRRRPLDIVFVIDELDKLESAHQPTSDDKEKADRFSALADGLKPTLMCGHAHFLLVAGMEEYLRWYNGLAAEDDRFINLFNGHFAVPALDPTGIQRLFRQLFSSPKEADEPLMVKFRDYLAMESLGRPRRFLTEFTRYVGWRPQPALQFTKKQIDRIAFGARLQQCVQAAWMQTLQQWDLPAAVDDMLRTRTIQWVKAMARRAGAPFQLTQILRPEELKQPHEIEYQEHAWSLLLALSHAMEAEGMLAGDGAEDEYTWKDADDAYVYAYGVSPDSVRHLARVDVTVQAAAAVATTAGAPAQAAAEAVPEAAPEDARSRALLLRLAESLSLPAGAPADRVLAAAGTALQGRGAALSSLSTALETGNVQKAAAAGITLLTERICQMVPQLLHMEPVGRGRNRLEPDLVLRVDDAQVDGLQIAFAGSGITRSTLEHWMGDALRLTAWPDIARMRQLRCLVIDLSDQPVPADVVERFQKMWVAFPIPVKLSVVSRLDWESIGMALGRPILELGPARGTCEFRCVSGNGYVHLNWRPQRDLTAMIYRSSATGVDDARVVATLDGAVGEYTDLDVTLGVIYIYRLVDAAVPDLALGADLANPTHAGSPKDSRYWRALLERVAFLDPAPAEPAVVDSLGHVRQLLAELYDARRAGARAGGAAIQARPETITAAATLGLIEPAGEGYALTPPGVAAAGELRSTEAPETFLKQLIYHPAVRRLLVQLRTAGKLRVEAPIMAGLSAGAHDRAWMAYIIEQTRALRMEFGWVYWERPDAPALQVNGADTGKT